MLISQLLQEKDFTTDWFKHACLKLKQPFVYHRKLWEFCYIYQGLLENNMLRPGKRGLGFGVGQEPLVSLFAAHGCEIVATDLDFASAKAQGWVETNQHCPGDLAALNACGLCEPEQFEQLVTFEYLDMNYIDKKYMNAFDFTWSSSSFEHIGSIELAQQFIVNQMNCLRPGGIAIHTTEFNLSSNDDTLASNTLVLFRRQDIDRMVQALRNLGYLIEIDYTVGTGARESRVDTPPYTAQPHLRLQIGPYVTTSFGLIIKKMLPL